MYRFIILIMLVSTSAITIAQTPIQKNQTKIIPIQKFNLTIEQTKWLQANYKFMGSLHKDSVKIFIKNMPDQANVNEANFDFIISHFTRLSADESSIQNRLQELRSEKQALQNKILSEQHKLEIETDTTKKQKLLAGIRQLYLQLELINREIKRLQAKLNLMLKNAFVL